MEASTCPYHKMAHCLSVGLVFTLAIATLLYGATGSGIGRMMDRQNSELKIGYHRNSAFPAGVVYTVGDHHPGHSGNYPTSAEGGKPEAAGGDLVYSEGDGKIPGGVAVDDEVEVFNVPQSNQRRYPGRRQPGRWYPSGSPSWWYYVVYPSVW